MKNLVLLTILLLIGCTDDQSYEKSIFINSRTPSSDLVIISNGCYDQICIPETEFPLCDFDPSTNVLWKIQNGSGVLLDELCTSSSSSLCMPYYDFTGLSSVFIEAYQADVACLNPSPCYFDLFIEDLSIYSFSDGNCCLEVEDSYENCELSFDVSLVLENETCFGQEIDHWLITIDEHLFGTPTDVLALKKIYSSGPHTFNLSSGVLGPNSPLCGKDLSVEVHGITADGIPCGFCKVVISSDLQGSCCDNCLVENDTICINVNNIKGKNKVISELNIQDLSNYKSLEFIDSNGMSIIFAQGDLTKEMVLRSIEQNGAGNYEIKVLGQPCPYSIIIVVKDASQHSGGGVELDPNP